MCVYVYVRIDRGIEWKSIEKKIIGRPLEIESPSRGFHAPDRTRSSSTNRRYARPKRRRVRKSCFFSDGTSEGGSEEWKKKKGKEHDFNPIDFWGNTFRSEGESGAIDLSWTHLNSFNTLENGISRNFNDFIW